MSNLSNNLRSLYAMTMLAKHPDHVKYVFMIGDSQDEIAEGARAGGRMKDPFAAPELEQMWRERYCPARYDIGELARLEPGTLGGAYARHMLERGLKPDFYDEVPARHRMHYLRLRLRQTHDIWHVLSGYDTDQFGEVGLQAFYFAQVTNGQSALICAAALLKSVLRVRLDELERFFDVLCEGYARGGRCESLLPVKFEQLWREPLEDLRARFRIEPRR